MNKSEAHTILVRDSLQALAIHGYTGWANATGVWFDEETGRPHKYGKPGSADIFIILPIYIHALDRVIGLHVEAEAKTGNAKQSDKQKKHQKYVVERNGAAYFVFRSVNEILEKLAEIKRIWLQDPSSNPAAHG